MITICKDVDDIIYKYKHNMEWSDIMEELTLTVRIIRYPWICINTNRWSFSYWQKKNLTLKYRTSIHFKKI